MASCLHSAQSALRLCEKHDNKELTSFCRTCNIPICTQCVKSAHIHHDWDYITTVAKERRARLPEICREIQSNELCRVKEQLSAAGSVDEDSNIQIILTRKEALVNNINSLADKKMELSRKTKGLKSKERERVEKSMTYLEKMTKELDVNVGTFSDFDVLEMEQEMLNEVKALQSLCISETNERMVFVPGETSLDILSAMLGDIHDPSAIKVDLINSFKNAEIDRISLCPAKECKLWIAKEGKKEIYLLNAEGKMEKRQKLDHFNFVVDEIGEFFYTNFDEKSVKVLTAKGNTRTIMQTSPLHPTCIRLIKDKNLLVNVRDDGDPFQLTSKSRRLVQKINFNGDVLQTFEFADDGKTRLFIRPSKTAENKNGDICVINILSDLSGELLTLRPDGSVRFKYQGLHDPKDFDPYDVVCDSDGHIYVANYADKCVHALAYDGTFIKYLIRNLQSEPCSLSLHEEKLWLVCDDGTINIYSLSSRAVLS